MAEKLVSALQQEYTANSEEFFPPESSRGMTPW
jgi:hypothetical protein